MRALGRVGLTTRRLFYDLNFKLHGQILGWIAGGIVASLIAQHAVHFVFSRNDRMQGMYTNCNCEVSAINAEFFARRKRESAVFAGRVFGFSQHDIGRHLDAQRGWDKELRLGSVGVDVITGRHAEVEGDRGLLGTHSRCQWHGNHRQSWSLAESLRRKLDGPEKNEQNKTSGDAGAKLSASDDTHQFSSNGPEMIC